MADEEPHKPGLLRDKNFDPVYHREQYDMYPEFLSMTFHFGGSFTISPGRNYVGGQKVIIDWVNFETFEVKDLKTVVVEYGKLDPSFEMSFYFKRPGFNLDKGLIDLKSQEDVKLMVRLAKQTRYIEVYVEHGQRIVQESGETSNPICKRLFSDNEGNGGDGLEGLDILKPGRAKCDILLNNICESFNSKLVKGREKPIISCLEFIREYLMKRIVIVQREFENCKGPLTPRATEILEMAKEEAHKVNVIFNGSDLYQVSGPWDEQCVVNMTQRKCTCRKWELTGIPCKHAVASIWNMHDNGFDTGEVEDWVHYAYSLVQWEKVYSYKINPIIGTNYWPRSEDPLKILPPKHHTQVGRQKKKRRRGEFENESIVKDGKLSKKGKTITCSKCKQKGHNDKTCKGQSQNAHPKRATQSKTKKPKTQTSQPMSQPSQSMGQPSQSMGQPSQSSARGPKVVHSPEGIRMCTPKFAGEHVTFNKPSQA